MRPRRTHSREFKLMVVRQVANGEKRPAQICREHDLGESLLLRWRREYEARGEAAFSPRDATGTEVLAQRVAGPRGCPERFCGQLALENAVLKKALSSSRPANGTR